MTDRRPWCRYCRDYTDHDDIKCSKPTFKQLEHAFDVAYNLIIGMLTDSQLDFKQPDGLTGRDKINFLTSMYEALNLDYEDN